MVDEKIVVAFIAGSISLVVAFVGYKKNREVMLASEDKLRREFQLKFTEKLYEKRIELYPQAYKTAGRIRRLSSPEYITPAKYRKVALDELNIWAEGEAGLYMSSGLELAYFNFRKALSRNPGHGDCYSKEQADNLWQARSAFREALRGDLGNLHLENSGDKSSDSL